MHAVISMLYTISQGGTATSMRTPHLTTTVVNQSRNTP